MKNIKQAILTAFLLGFGFNSYALNWPTKEVTIIVPFPAGGTVDKIVRDFANDLPNELGKPVVVKNVPGAYNIVAINELSKSDPDHTFLATFGSVISSGVALKDDSYKMLDPVMIFGESRIALVKNVNASAQEVIDARKKNTKIMVARGDTIDNGQMWLDSIPGLSVEYIPYKGATGYLLAVMQGEPKFGDCSIFCVYDKLQNGQLGLAFVAGDKRSSFAPDVPTARELGLKDDGKNYNTIYLITSLKTINPEVAEAMNKALKKVGETNPSIQGFGKRGMDLTLMNVAQSKKLWYDQERFTVEYFKKHRQKD